jgi:type II secretory pathway pseudopilin PulG
MTTPQERQQTARCAWQVWPQPAGEWYNTISERNSVGIARHPSAYPLPAGRGEGGRRPGEGNLPILPSSWYNRCSETASRPQAAFTLVELVVVLGLVALGLLMLAPGLARTQPNSRTLQCLNNKRQLALACSMYTRDWNDYLVPNAPASDSRGWCNGQENWYVASANINPDYYTTNCFSPYVGGQLKVYKCPGDTILSDNGDRIRSISMNCMMMGAIPVPQGNGFNTGWKVYRTCNDLVAPTPDMAWIFADESMWSLNDGFLQMNLNGFDYPEMPAAYHGGINCFTFGDGHVEAHQWRWKRSYYAGLLSVPYAKGVTGGHWASSGLDVDYYWLKARTSAPQ